MTGTVFSWFLIKFEGSNPVLVLRMAAVPRLLQLRSCAASNKSPSQPHPSWPWQRMMLMHCGEKGDHPLCKELGLRQWARCICRPAVRHMFLSLVPCVAKSFKVHIADIPCATAAKTRSDAPVPPLRHFDFGLAATHLQIMIQSSSINFEECASQCISSHLNASES